MKCSQLALLHTLILFLLTGTNARAANPQIQLTTNQGVIIAELFADKAPITVNNILEYVDSGYYSNTLFHRVISNFMVQGGGYTTEYKKKKTNLPIPNEAYNGLKNLKGTLAMARTSNPHSGTSQFFINVNDNSFLDFEMAPLGPLNTVRRSQLGIKDSITGKIATTDCRGRPITRQSLTRAQESVNEDNYGYSCLMQAILQDSSYNIDNELKACLPNIAALKQSGKLGKDKTCSDYVNNRHKAIKLIHVRWGYAVFGKVIKGHDVLEVIKNANTGPAGPFRQDAPEEAIIIQSISRI